jgi:hypothetical protein
MNVMAGFVPAIHVGRSPCADESKSEAARVSVPW